MNRYRIQFTNGHWVIFDTHTYKNMESFKLLKDAKEKFNA